MHPIVLRAVRDVPALQLHAGDLVVIRPGHPRPVVIQYEIEPNYGALLLHAEEGALVPDDPAQPIPRVAALLRQAVPDPPPPPRPWRRRPNRRLTVLR